MGRGDKEDERRDGCEEGEGSADGEAGIRNALI